MTKVAVPLAAALLALGALSEPCSAQTRPVPGPPERVAWIVGQGFSNLNGYPWPGPPWAWPVPAPRRGCYVYSQHLAGAWRQVEICE